MTNLKEIKFALENGFTTVEKVTEKDGSIAFHGAFGYVVTTSNEEVTAIENLINEYTTEEEVKTFEQELTSLFGNKYEIKSAQIKSLLNNKIEKVEKLGKGIAAVYKFKVEGDKEECYRLSAHLTGKGKWWVKRSVSMH